MSELQSLFQNISQAKNEGEFRSTVLVRIGQYFDAKRQGIFFFDRLPKNPKNFPSNFQAALSIERNPVLRYLVERHTPVSENLVVSPRVWQIICPRRDHWHVMAGPLVDNGQLIGGIGFTRDRDMAAFNSQNLMDLSALCLHISTWLTKINVGNATQERLPDRILNRDRLTSRELQIVRLVALGKTNAQIGTELWITENSVKQALKRIFRKLEVSSRVEMVAKLKLD